jgi:hypothetical protein
MKIWKVFRDWATGGVTRAAIPDGWTDTDLGTRAQVEGMLRKPINMKTFEFKHEHIILRGDTLRVRITEVDPLTGRLCEIEATPPTPICSAFHAKRCTKFEVRDDFGDDVGIGVVVHGREIK